MQAAEWVCLLGGLLALTITEQYAWYVTVGLGLMAAGFLLRGWRTGHWLGGTGQEAPMVLFGSSALLAAWISYDASAAWLQMGRIAAAFMLFYAVVDLTVSWRWWVAAGFALAATGLAVYWPLQHEFMAGQAKFGFIDAVGERLNELLPTIPGPSIHANVAAGTLALGLVFGVACAWEAWKRRLWLLAGLFGLCGAVIAGGLVLTSSRGAWVALAGVAGLAGLARAQRRWFGGKRARAAFWLACTGAVAVVAFGLWASGWLERLMGQVPDPTGTMQGRMSLWGQGLGLIEDAPLTGSGLMAFRMVYAVYGVLIHVPLHDHLHNTYLEVWLEQGVVGLLALTWGMLAAVGWAWQALGRGRVNVWGWAGLAALAAAGIHGMFDVVFYVTRTLPLIGLAAGFAFWAADGAGERRGSRGRPVRLAAWAGLGAAALILVAIFYRPILGTINANAGVVSQTRLELTMYDPASFADPTLDLVRRELDLSQAEGFLREAITWDETNLTARQRLAAIGLSRGEYAEALAWMGEAWEGGARDEVTRLLYGDALVAMGRPEEGAEVVRGIGWAEDRLAFQAWYRYWLGVPPGESDYQRCAWAWEAVLLLNPEYPGAQEGLEKAEEKLSP